LNYFKSIYYIRIAGTLQVQPTFPKASQRIKFENHCSKLSRLVWFSRKAGFWLCF